MAGLSLEDCKPAEVTMRQGSNTANARTLISVAVREHSRPLRRFLGHRVPDAHVDDVAQETFLKLIESMNASVNRENVRSYLVQIAKGRIAEFWKRQAKDAHIEWADDMERLVENIMVANSGLYKTGNLEERALSLETLHRIYRATARMPSTLSAPLLLRVIEGLSYQEIARRVGTSENAAKQNVRRARELLERFRA